MSRITAIVGNSGLGPAIAREPLSEAEQALATQVSVESHQDIMSLNADADHLFDLAVGLENLESVVASIESASDVELQLIDVASDLVVAGTPLTGEVVTPGLESCSGERVSVEGIKTIAQNVWKSIKDFAKKVWKKIETFFHSIFGRLPRIRKALVALKDRADTYHDKSIEESKTEVDAAINPLVVDNVAPKTGSAIETNLSTVKDMVNFLFDEYTVDIIKRGEVIKTGLKDYKPTKDWDAAKHGTALDKVNEFDDKMDTLAGKAGIKNEIKNDSRFGDKFKVCGLPITGNMSVFYQSIAAEAGDTSLGKAEDARSRIIRVMSTREKAQEKVEEHEVDTLSVSDIKTVVDCCIDIVDGIESWERGKNSGKLKKLGEDVLAAGDKLDKEVEKLDDVTSELRAYPKAAQGFVKSFTTWSSEPHSTITGNALAAVNAAIAVCNKSLSNYK